MSWCNGILGNLKYEITIKKYDYMERIFKIHKILYEYSDFINNSNIIDIKITSNEVIYKFLSKYSIYKNY